MGHTMEIPGGVQEQCRSRDMAVNSSFMLPQLSFQQTCNAVKPSSTNTRSSLLGDPVNPGAAAASSSCSFIKGCHTQPNIEA